MKTLQKNNDLCKGINCNSCQLRINCYKYKNNMHTASLYIAMNLNTPYLEIIKELKKIGIITTIDEITNIILTIKKQ